MFPCVVGGSDFREHKMKSPGQIRIGAIYPNKWAFYVVLTGLVAFYSKGSPEIAPVQFISTCP